MAVSRQNATRLAETAQLSILLEEQIKGGVARTAQPSGPKSKKFAIIGDVVDSVEEPTNNIAESTSAPPVFSMTCCVEVNRRAIEIVLYRREDQ
jgi:hypothetical protein